MDVLKLELGSHQYIDTKDINEVHIRYICGKASDEMIEAILKYRKAGQSIRLAIRVQLVEVE
jgi:hypothetical protein